MAKSKVDKAVEAATSESAKNLINKKIAIALCEVDGINPDHEVYLPGGGMVPAWEYAILDADKVRRVAEKLGWVTSTEDI